MTFEKTGVMRVLKVGMDSTPYIKWDWKFVSGNGASKPYMLKPDPIRLDEYWIIGNMEGYGAAFKLKRFDNNVIFKARFLELKEILAFYQVPNSENIYGCGY
jgi:hypothetical protein